MLNGWGRATGHRRQPAVVVVLLGGHVVGDVGVGVGAAVIGADAPVIDAGEAVLWASAWALSARASSARISRLGLTSFEHGVRSYLLCLSSPFPPPSTRGRRCVQHKVEDVSLPVFKVTSPQTLPTSTAPALVAKVDFIRSCTEARAGGAASLREVQHRRRDSTLSLSTRALAVAQVKLPAYTRCSLLRGRPMENDAP